MYCAVLEPLKGDFDASFFKVGVLHRYLHSMKGKCWSIIAKYAER